MLDAGYDANAAEFRPQIVSIEVQDVPGVLNQVTGKRPIPSFQAYPTLRLMYLVHSETGCHRKAEATLDHLMTVNCMLLM